MQVKDQKGKQLKTYCLNILAGKPGVRLWYNKVYGFDTVAETRKERPAAAFK